MDDSLRLQHVQLRGTHNSYHQRPELVVHPSHDYSQPSLTDQLGLYGVRTFELDVHQHDEGWLVYHIWFLDQATSCETFAGCLSEMVAWSTDHPGHLPIIVWIEAKEQSGGDTIKDPTLIDVDIFVSVPKAILYTPDDLRGEHTSVAEALAKDGWPTLSELRGKLMVVLLSTDKSEAYRADAPGLEGRAMFVRAEADELDAPWAAFAKGLSGAELTDALSRNLLVARNICSADDEDADCVASLADRSAAGYHMLKDDFPAPIEGKDYVLSFPGDVVARCNPVTAPAECQDAALEGVIP